MTEHRIRVGWVAIFAVLFGLTFWQIADARHDASVKADNLAESVAEKQAERDLALDRLEESTGQTMAVIAQVRRCQRDPEACGSPVVRPNEIPPNNVPPTSGITQADVELAVADYFQRYPIRAPGVPLSEIRLAVSEYLSSNPPRDGRAPTDGEIARAVTAYLDANPPPAGADGATGAQGPAGADGQDGQDGADGQDGTDGVDALPFTFSFVIPGKNPADPDLTFVVTCTVDGCTTVMTSP